MAEPATFPTTLYLLRRQDCLEMLIRAEYLDAEETMSVRVEVAGHEGLLLTTSATREEADWSRPLTQLTGVVPGPSGSSSASAALLIAVDDYVFALTHGHSGRWMLDPDAIERLFGLRIAIRVLEPLKVRQLTRLALDVSARVDRNFVPGGQEVRGYGVEQYAEVINKIGGRAAGLELTYSRQQGVPVRLDGADALTIRIGCEPRDCVADLRELLTALAREPVADLAFIERIRRLPASSSKLSRQATALGHLLHPDANGPIGLAVPVENLDDEDAGLTYRVVAGEVDEPANEMSLEVLQRAVASHPPDERLDQLRVARVHSLPEDERRRPSRADRWIIAEITDGISRYVFQQGDWYEVTGQEYLEALTEETRDIFKQRLGWNLQLPPWTTRREDAYLHQFMGKPGFLVLDQDLVRSPTQPGGFEAGDLLGPHNELIHVKGARSSAPLSHLFNQGLVAADTLCSDPRAWDLFQQKVHALDHTRQLGPRPAAIVYAIHLKTRQQLTADTLFTFSRIALVRAYRHIRHRLNVPVAIAVIP